MSLYYAGFLHIMNAKFFTQYIIVGFAFSMRPMAFMDKPTTQKQRAKVCFMTFLFFVCMNWRLQFLHL